MAGGVHFTSPLYFNSALVISLTSYLPSALKQKPSSKSDLISMATDGRISQNYKVDLSLDRILLVIQHNIWQPNSFAWDVQGLYATIFSWVPLQFVVIPVLQKC